MGSFDELSQVFWQWLVDNKVALSDGIAFKDYRNEHAGRGVVATRNIEEGEMLFTLPRSALFSTMTAALVKKDGMADVLEGLTGWSPLILCMMYELDRPDSQWKPYFDVLPRTFSTPMFWPDLTALKGTGVLDKIGKEEADQCYDDQILPILKAHPDLFDLQVHTKDLFHICGSLIMSYSFHDEYKDEQASQQNDDASDEEEEEEEDEGLLAMVPMADMLNHKTGFNNARLFHEPEGLVMKAIKAIATGEQVYNTYGDLCNADLLRKYGFTDDNNPFDLCEIDGRDIVALATPEDQDETVKEEKLNYLMDEGVMDDCFVIDGDHEIPPEMIASVIVFASPVETFKKWEQKGKVPSPKLTLAVQEILLKILEGRLKKYDCSLQDDLDRGMTFKDENEKNAFRIRLGEKKILETTITKLRQDMPTKRSSSPLAGSVEKKQRK
ncbi:RuBisCO-cytochrome methylase [Hesseltinella vesiculosa]|uniref:RuBisCO-cytochrome methylase n=1 Tax=Hesseltinella vesiculosa TaxID=101127 RepID=A0A1X2G7V5_9FUNG|nr:RuBisCO-cytochrome methylase [Hesseltinella vesiculosa]